MSGRQKKKKLQEARQRRTEVQKSQRWEERIARGEVILADRSKHAPHNSYSPPEFYEDREFTCRDCGKVEVWTARQQQWWYEVAKGPIYSTAVRCRECRRRGRQQHGQQERT